MDFVLKNLTEHFHVLWFSAISKSTAKRPAKIRTKRPGILSNAYNIRLQPREIGVSKISMKITLLITVALAGMFLSSCNTMIGLGRDMRMGGEGLEKTANKSSGGSSGGDTSGAPVY